MEIRPLTENQKELFNALNDEKIKILVVIGPSGSGKSLLTFNYCLEAIKNKKFERIVLFKPIFDVSTKQLYSILQLGELYFKNVEDYLYDLIVALRENWNEIKKLIGEKIIISDLSSLLGRTFDNSIILIEDAHVLKSENLIEILMRLGKNSRLILIGDALLQVHNSLSTLKTLLKDEANTKIVELGFNDIIRQNSKLGIRLWIENRIRSREMSSEERAMYEKIKEETEADIMTIIDMRNEKEEIGIKSENVADIIVVTKDYGKVVGKEGQTISKLENELNVTIRVLQNFLDEKELIRVLHPAGRIYKQLNAEIKGSTFYIYSSKELRPIVLGTKGVNIRYFERALKKILPLDVIVV